MDKDIQQAIDEVTKWASKYIFYIGVGALFIGASAYYAIAETSSIDIEGTVQILKDHNLTPTQIGGYAWGQCNNFYTYRTKFVATDSSGQRVTGAACSGSLISPKLELN